MPNPFALPWMEWRHPGMGLASFSPPRFAPPPADPLENKPLNEDTYSGAYGAHERLAEHLDAPLVGFLARVAQALRNQGFEVGEPEKELDSPTLTRSWICSFGFGEGSAHEADLVLGLSFNTEQAPANQGVHAVARHDVYVGLGYLQTNENLVGERLEDAPLKPCRTAAIAALGQEPTLRQRLQRLQALLEAADEAALAASFARALDR